MNKHQLLFKLFLPFLNIYSKLAYRFKAAKPLDEDGPFFIIANHTTNIDFLFVALSLKKDIYFVASEHAFRGGKLSRLLLKLFEPIQHDKADVGIATVMKIRKHLKAGHNVCLFAEGGKSFNGQSLKAIPTTAAVAQKMKAKIATLRISGGYFSSPLWGKNNRKGKMHSEWVNVYQPEDLKEMSAQDFTDAINQDIFVDAYQENEELNIKFKGKDLAENIELVLFACPKCKALNSISSQGNHFSCSCGLEGEYHANGKISSHDFDFQTITDWDKWQREYLNTLTFQNDEIMIQDGQQCLIEIKENHETVTVEEGTLALTPRIISVGNHQIRIEDIKRLSIIKHGNLLFSTKDDHYYEIDNHGKKYSGYLYMLLVEKFNEQHHELTERIY